MTDRPPRRIIRFPDDTIKDLASLKGEDLYEADMPFADFTQEDLSGTNLDDATLTKAKFDEATLVGASFINANLQGASFLKSQLRGANFRGAKLDGCHFEGASIEKANLQGAALSGSYGIFPMWFPNIATDKILGARKPSVGIFIIGIIHDNEPHLLFPSGVKLTLESVRNTVEGKMRNELQTKIAINLMDAFEEWAKLMRDN